MKKVSSKKYARTLYDVVSEKEQKEIEPVLREFVRLLVANNDFSQVDAIIKEFGRIWNREKGIIESEVVSAMELDTLILEKIKSIVEQISGQEKVDIKNEVNKDILGGVVIRYGDKRIDGSLKTQIKNLRIKLYN